MEANRPLGNGERIDLNHATAQQLTRLPGVGPSLAERIVDNRNQEGPFPSVGALARVRGIGLAAVRRLEPFLHAIGEEATTLGGALVDLNRATAAELERLPGLGPAKVARLAPMVKVP